MTGADIFIGRTVQGEFLLKDYHANGFEMPIPDDVNNLVVLSSHQDGNVTSFTFQRALKAGCKKEDLPIHVDGTAQFLIYAFSESNALRKHDDDKRGMCQIVCRPLIVRRNATGRLQSRSVI